MKIELCVASIEALLMAKELELDRVELCQSLEQGGITPSVGLIEYALSLGLETHVLIRPRSGGFRYSKTEIEIIIRDIIVCKSLGVHGVVVGVLDEHNQVNHPAMQLIMNEVGELDVTFHRAFDDTDQFDKTIDTLVDLGVTRILSSGLAQNVELGMSTLTEMVAYANGRIDIMPGGGVEPNNIKLVVETVKPSAIHFSGTIKTVFDEHSMFSEPALVPFKNKIQGMLEAIK